MKNVKNEKQNVTAKLIYNLFHLNSTLIISGVTVGVLSGGVSIIYRLALAKGEDFLYATLNFIQGKPVFIILWFVVLFFLALIVGKILKWEPMATGSGIPQIIGEMKGYFDPAWWRVMIAKFLGGVLCIFGGLSLGREGPSLQIGAMSGKALSKTLKAGKTQERNLITAGASAGLAAAFNAPLAGIMFSLEEVHKNFSAAILISIMVASVSAEFVSENVFGLSPVFSFHVNAVLPLQLYWMVIILGVLLGVLGALYNRTTLWVQKLYEKMKLKTEYKLVIPFMAAGILGFVLPQVLGSGHTMIELLTQGNVLLMTALVLLVVKFLFSIFSFGSGAPGGIFFPLLVIGAYIGEVFGLVAVSFLGISPDIVNNFIILAMAGYFAAIVRAPITGIVLIAEMTGTLKHLLPLAIVAMVAYYVAYLLKSSPIYESLLDNLLIKFKSHKRVKSGERMITEIVVHHGACAAGKKISEIDWPVNCLLISIRRGGNEIIPKGNTIIIPSDTLVALVDVDTYYSIEKQLQDVCVNKVF
jgi:H+/Cl- antiporter ClcA